MDTRQKKLIDMVLVHEGGYNAGDPHDSGGQTYRGIARNYFPKWKGWAIVDASKPLRYNQIIKNNPELDNLIYDFYATQFYSPMRVGDIENLMIAGHLLCHGVNAGIKNGVKTLQKAINSACKAAIKVDGVVGNITLGYCNGTNAEQIASAFIKQRESYYRNIVAKKPTLKKFLNGWLNRVKSTTKACSQSASSSGLYFMSDTGSVLAKILGWIFDTFIRKTR